MKSLHYSTAYDKKKEQQKQSYVLKTGLKGYER